jgi:hypothetical protein
VVRGVHQWQQRLEVYASELERYADQREHDGVAEGIDAARARAARARIVAQSVLALADALTPPPSGGT